MSFIEPILAAVINGWLARPEKQGGSRMAGLWLLAMSCLLACAGLVYLLIGFDTWMSVLYGPVTASLSTALGAFILAGCAAGGFAWAERPKPAKPSPEEQSLKETAEALFTMLEQATEGLETPIAENPRTSLALASLAGYMTANRLH